MGQKIKDIKTILYRKLHRKLKIEQHNNSTKKQE
jgi:hypothetical protein